MSAVLELRGGEGTLCYLFRMSSEDEERTPYRLPSLDARLSSILVARDRCLKVGGSRKIGISGWQWRQNTRGHKIITLRIVAVMKARKTREQSQVGMSSIICNTASG